jgi:hypothetical protein
MGFQTTENCSCTIVIDIVMPTLVVGMPTCGPFHPAQVAIRGRRT